MNSASIGTILSIISLVGVGVLYVKMDDLSDQVRPLTKARADRKAVEADPLADEYERDEPARPVSDDRVLPEHAPDGKVPKTRPSRERELEERIAKLEKEAKRPKLPFRMPKFARNVSDLSKTLKLDKTQETRIQGVVDRAKRRIEDVLKIPDESGVSPYDRRKQAREKMREAMKAGKMPDINALMESRNATLKTIPGRNTTYADEIKTIKNETRDEINSNLNADQQKEFKDTRIDPLLGESGARSVMAFHGGTGDGSEPGGAVIVEGEVDIHTESEEKDDDK